MGFIIQQRWDMTLAQYKFRHWVQFIADFNRIKQLVKGLMDQSGYNHYDLDATNIVININNYGYTSAVAFIDFGSDIEYHSNPSNVKRAGLLLDDMKKPMNDE